jgi:hypothetical protein
MLTHSSLRRLGAALCASGTESSPYVDADVV